MLLTGSRRTEEVPENSDAYFVVQQQALEDLSAKEEKVNKLAKHLASIMGTQDIVS